MDLGQISDEDRLTSAKTIAAYGTHNPTIDQRRPNIECYRSIETSDGSVKFYNDKADGALVMEIRQHGI